MRILALDTATAACSVAVWSAGVKAGRSAAMARGQAEALMPMVAATMADAGLAFAELDLIAVTVGPGSFTGLRIGLAAARGMALAADRPCLGITTLAAVAASVGPVAGGGAVLAVVESNRGDVFAQAFGPDGDPLGPPVAAAARDLATRVPLRPLTVVGAAAGPVAAALTAAGRTAVAAAPAMTVAAAVAEIASRQWRKDGPPPRAPSPLYLRSPDTGPVSGPGRRP
ncbi:MAG: tRNA (adenosine(37)-N6)-threonylcarbamoyltransferase complex dimerization subunit type 1 TsaB [Rhodospirillales bacterium]